MEKIKPPSRQEVLKALRAERKKHIARTTALMKAQKKDIEAITRFLEGGEATVPDIARGVDMPADKALWYMATLKKYGRIAEGPKDGSFFRYSLVRAAETKAGAEGGI